MDASNTTSLYPVYDLHRLPTFGSKGGAIATKRNVAETNVSAVLVGLGVAPCTTRMPWACNSKRNRAYSLLFFCTHLVVESALLGGSGAREPGIFVLFTGWREGGSGIH